LTKAGGDQVGHSAPVFSKWNPPFPGGWVHKLLCADLESMDFKTYKPGWALPEISEKTAYKIIIDFVGRFLT